MNAPAPCTFRGSRAVDDVIDRLRPLADHLKSFHPSCTAITLRERDLAVLLRYPDASRAADVAITDNGIFWRNFELRADRKRRPTPRPS